MNTNKKEGLIIEGLRVSEGIVYSARNPLIDKMDPLSYDRLISSLIKTAGFKEFEAGLVWSFDNKDINFKVRLFLDDETPYFIFLTTSRNQDDLNKIVEFTNNFYNYNRKHMERSVPVVKLRNGASFSKKIIMLDRDLKDALALVPNYIHSAKNFFKSDDSYKSNRKVITI